MHGIDTTHSATFFHASVHDYGILCPVLDLAGKSPCFVLREYVEYPLPIYSVAKLLPLPKTIAPCLRGHGPGFQMNSCPSIRLENRQSMVTS